MATTNISINAPTLIAGIPNPDLAVSVLNYGGPVANTPLDVSDVSISVNVDHDVGVYLNGLGEESVPEPTLFKYNEDLFFGSDSVSILVKPRYYDNSILVESLKFNAIKGNIDVIPIAEKLSIAAIKVLTSTHSVSDFIGLSTTKSLNDNFNTSDVLSTTWNILRTYTDIVQTTDDVLGDANIDDDQYMSFGKGLIDNGYASDELVCTWNVLRTYSDSSALSERLTFNAIKSVTEDLDLAEYTAFDITKPLVDFGNLDDELSTEWLILRTYTDSASLSERLSFNSNKLLLDYGNIEHRVEVDFEKTLLNELGALDTLVTTWTILRSYSDNAELSDTYSIYLNKAPLDNVSSAENISTEWDIFRNYSDLIQTTDDVLGNANIDDDQYMLFGKGLIDNSSVVDLFSWEWDVNRTYSDQITNTENLSLGINKGINEQLSYGEYLSLITSKAVVDSSSITDTISSDFNKYAEDTSLILDTQYLGFNKPFEDSTYATDSISSNWFANREFLELTNSSEILSFYANKVLQDTTGFIETWTVDLSTTLLDISDATDTISTEWIIARSLLDSTSYSESLNFVNQKTILDLVQVSDDILGLANIDDDQYVTVGKGEVDSVSLAEVVTFLFITGRVIIDSALLSEVVTINKQDYFASDFVVPYYVGELYTV